MKLITTRVTGSSNPQVENSSWPFAFLKNLVTVQKTYLKLMLILGKSVRFTFPNLGFSLIEVAYELWSMVSPCKVKVHCKA